MTQFLWVVICVYSSSETLKWPDKSGFWNVGSYLLGKYSFIVSVAYPPKSETLDRNAHIVRITWYKVIVIVIFS